MYLIFLLQVAMDDDELLSYPESAKGESEDDLSMNGEVLISL